MHLRCKYESYFNNLDIEVIGKENNIGWRYSVCGCGEVYDKKKEIEYPSRSTQISIETGVPWHIIHSPLVNCLNDHLFTPNLEHYCERRVDAYRNGG